MRFNSMGPLGRSIMAAKLDRAKHAREDHREMVKRITGTINWLARRFGGLTPSL